MRRYPSCENLDENGDSNCAFCSSSSYGCDCHNINCSKEPRLKNTPCYPWIFDDIEAIARLVFSGDFPEEEINQLSEDLEAARSGRTFQPD